MSIPKQKGFTWIELLWVLSLVSITSSLFIIPAYQRWVMHFRLEMKARQLLKALRFARNLAVQSHMTVTVCKSEDKQGCGGKWENGWIIIAQTKGVKPQLLRIYPGLDKQQSLTWQGARKVEAVQFNAFGSSTGWNGRFILRNQNSQLHKKGWMIQVSSTGRARLESFFDSS